MRFHDEVLPHLRKVKAELEKLNHMKIKIGIQGSGTNWQNQRVSADADLLTIARVHEYGATITASGKNLCIPIHKDSYDKSPRDFQDLFFIRSKDGYLFGVVAKRGGGTRRTRITSSSCSCCCRPSPSRSAVSSGRASTTARISWPKSSRKRSLSSGKASRRREGRRSGLVVRPWALSMSL